jgi:enamine deaminase RidA (YjgF/YER057c/UK114 family)
MRLFQCQNDLLENQRMPITRHNPTELFPQYRNYSHAVEVSGDSRLLFISGLNGYLSDGKTMPDSFEGQGQIIWGHIGSVIKSVRMTYDNIVSLRTYLAGPEYDEPNVILRMKYLGNNQPASTVICCQLLESKWKLEIEAVAAS